MYLYHYYDISTGPFKNLSNLPIEEAEIIQNEIRKKGEGFAAKRDNNYLKRRIELEKKVRDIFIKKGGKPATEHPHYMVIEECEFLKSWYKDGKYVAIDINKFDKSTISFCYGDMFPNFSDKTNDNREYRKQVYTYDEIIRIIDKYGLPQVWNKDGKYGPERYIEVQVWSNDVIKKLL